MLNGVVDTERPGEITLVCGFTPTDLQGISRGTYRVAKTKQKGLPMDINLVLFHGESDGEIESFLRTMGAEGDLTRWQEASPQDLQEIREKTAAL